MFNFLKNKLKKIYSTITTKLSNLFAGTTVDEETLEKLQTILIEADVGIGTTKKIINNLRTKIKAGTIEQGQDLKNALEQELLDLTIASKGPEDKKIFLLVGINGSGKTTFTAKLANSFAKQNKKVLLVAADTFRAAATEQLEQWAKKTSVAIETGAQGLDPAAVVFRGCQRFKNENFDILIIDTAGRLQTKVNLMKELEKIKKNIVRHLPDEHIETLLTIDSMLGQNSLTQARIFNESTNVNGIILTKMDGTAKGGIIFAIMQELSISISYISFGEQLDQFKKFDGQEYIKELLQ